MKMFLWLCCLSLVSILFAKPSILREDYVHGEYIARFPNQISALREQHILNTLKSKFDLELINKLPVGKLNFVLLKGKNALNLASVAEVKGILTIERNAIGHITQADECINRPAPKAWGLDRIDQREKLAHNDPHSDETTYISGLRQGTGTTVYIFDTGINTTHYEFGGRATWGMSAGGYVKADNHGHGTHIAGIVGSVSYGVAKDVDLVAVKTVNDLGNSNLGDVHEGLEWMITDHNSRAGGTGIMAKSVALIGSTYKENTSLDTAIKEAIDAGITVVVSAGNDNEEACMNSPGRVNEVITVGQYC